MKYQLKKALCMLLSVVMVISLLPSAFVAGADKASTEDWEYQIVEENIMITRYIGDETEVIIPSEIDGMRVTMIGQDAFYFPNEITSITIPESVRKIVYLWSIYYSIFEQCHSLEKINVDDRNPVFSSQDGILYSKDKAGLLQYPQGKKGNSFVIPNSVTYLGNYAFLDCVQLTGITIPNGVVGISNRTFKGCTGLIDINIPNSVLNIGTFAFAGCTGLSSITIPNSVTKIGKGAFSGCSNLKKAVFMGKKPILGEEAPRPIDENCFIDQSVFDNTHKDFILYYPRWYEKNWSDYIYYPKQSHCEGGIPVEKVIIDRKKITLNKNKKYQLKATVSPNNATNTNVTWSTSDSKVAIVSQTGMVTAKGKGKCEITVVTEDGNERASCQITVNVSVTKVKLNRKQIKLKKGKKYILKAKIMPQNASTKKVSWRSSNKKIATVSKKGVVKAKKRGKCTITVITKDGNRKAKCKVTVK